MKARIERFRAWWNARDERERRILSAGAVVLALAAGYVAIWQPARTLHQRRITALAEARTLAVQLETLAAESRGAQGGAVSSRDQSLGALIEQAGKSSGIGKSPSLQPDGDNSVRVGFEDIPFDTLIRWLGDLRTRHGVRVSGAEIDRTSGSGLVNARLTLVR